MTLSDMAYGTCESLADMVFGNEKTTDIESDGVGGWRFQVIALDGTRRATITVIPGAKPERAGDDDDHEGMDINGYTLAGEIASDFWTGMSESVWNEGDENDEIVGAIKAFENDSYAWTDTVGKKTVKIIVWG